MSRDVMFSSTALQMMSEKRHLLRFFLCGNVLNTMKLSGSTNEMSNV
jgi:hypothetical protein